MATLKGKTSKTLISVIAAAERLRKFLTKEILIRFVSVRHYQISSTKGPWLR